jgi:hypothetical protein
MGDGTAAVVKAWHDLDWDDRMAVLRSDPQAVDQAWRELRL